MENLPIKKKPEFYLLTKNKKKMRNVILFAALENLRFGLPRS